MTSKNITLSTLSLIHKEWISPRFVVLMGAEKIASEQRYDKKRNSLKLKLSKSLKKEHQQ